MGQTTERKTFVQACPEFAGDNVAMWRPHGYSNLTPVNNRQAAGEAASLLARIAAARLERNEGAIAVALAAEMRLITLAALYRLVVP
jgi:hypothetical protein